MRFHRNRCILGCEFTVSEQTEELETSQGKPPNQPKPSVDNVKPVIGFFGVRAQIPIQGKSWIMGLTGQKWLPPNMMDCFIRFPILKTTLPVLGENPLSWQHLSRSCRKRRWIGRLKELPARRRGWIGRGWQNWRMKTIRTYLVMILLAGGRCTVLGGALRYTNSVVWFRFMLWVLCLLPH